MFADILVWLAAASIGLSLGLLGSGGSIITVPVLIYLVGQDEKVAIAGSLAIVGTISLVACLPYLKSKLINGRAVVLFGLPGMAGTYIGAWLSSFVAGIAQLTLFAVVMLFAAWLMLKPVKLTSGAVKNFSQRENWKISLDGLLVGTLTGLVGVGGGFLIVPALVLLGGLSMHQAVATSLVIIALKSFTGLYKYLDVLKEQNLELDWNVIFIFSVIGVIGSFLGNYIAKKTPQAKLKKLFGVFLVLMSIYILAKSLPQFFT